MSSPSQNVRVKQPRGKKAPKEKRNIFGYMADALGMQTVKLARGQVPLLDRLKKIILGVSIYMAIGFVIGMVADIFLQAPWSLAQVFALLMLLVWLIRKGREYLK